MKEISIVIIFITSKAEHLHSIKFEIRFCACSNPACGVSEILDGDNSSTLSIHHQLRSLEAAVLMYPLKYWLLFRTFIS